MFVRGLTEANVTFQEDEVFLSHKASQLFYSLNHLVISPWPNDGLGAAVLKAFILSPCYSPKYKDLNL